MAEPSTSARNGLQSPLRLLQAPLTCLERSLGAWLAHGPCAGLEAFLREKKTSKSACWRRSFFIGQQLLCKILFKMLTVANWLKKKCIKFEEDPTNTADSSCTFLRDANTQWVTRSGTPTLTKSCQNITVGVSDCVGNRTL